MNKSKFLSFLTFLMILVFLSSKKYNPDSQELNWGFLAVILIASISALVFKVKESGVSKRNFYVLGFSTLGSFLILLYFLIY